MPYTLTFDQTSEGRGRFAILYEGLLIGSVKVDFDGIPMGELRKAEGSLLTKMEEISAVRMCEGEPKRYATQDVIRDLAEDGEAPRILVLTDLEEKILYSCVDALDWRISVVRQVDAILEWVKSCAHL